LIKKRSYNGKSPANDIHNKREELAEDELNRHDDDRYEGRGGSFESALEASNDAIRSMFGGLTEAKG